ncbi:MAG TPA: indole-3-glycerol-phosphate synthase [Thermoplasmata archaeon]|nr:indole-3-glycerol-phosphate synthase [Thermoplasmata archaeon]
MDQLAKLVDNARGLVARGYYRASASGVRAPSLREAIRKAERAVIAEVKLASPAAGALGPEDGVGHLLEAYLRGGACALSVLTEPNVFHGSLEHLRLAVGSGIPVLMKDIVVHPEQVECAANLGASAVLLIERAFHGHGVPHSSRSLIARAHALGLEVVLEVHTGWEYESAKTSEADVIGINQRDLATMELDRDTAARILREHRKDRRPVIAMSGIATRGEVEALRAAGADAVLVGTALVTSADPEAAVRALVGG